MYALTIPASSWRRPMRDVYQVLREKELEISRVREEVEALRAAIPLLADGEEAEPSEAPMRAVNSD
jgi:hypothetical protein